MSNVNSRWWALGASLLSTSLAACAAPEASSSETATAAADELQSDSALPDSEACTRIEPVPHFNDWPRIHSAIRSDANDEAWIKQVVAAMTLEQKVGQMTQGEIPSLFDATTGTYQLGDVTKFALGSILNGGGA